MDLHQVVSEHLDDIKKLFKVDAKVTIIMRTSDDAEGIVVITDDNLQTVMGQLAIAENWKPTIKPGEPYPKRCAHDNTHHEGSLGNFCDDCGAPV